MAPKWSHLTHLWRVVHDARRGGAVATGITAMIELARDDVETGHWDEAEQLVDEESSLFMSSFVAVHLAQADYAMAASSSRYLRMRR